MTWVRRNQAMHRSEYADYLTTCLQANERKQRIASDHAIACVWLKDSTGLAWLTFAFRTRIPAPGRTSSRRPSVRVA